MFILSWDTRIVTHGQDEKYGFTVYDPAMGSGSLLLQIRNFIKDVDGRENKSAVHFFGQEINNQTFNLARMNMMLHRVPASHQHLRQGDTLDADWPTDEPTNFDAVVMNPPYSLKWSAKPPASRSRRARPGLGDRSSQAAKFCVEEKRKPGVSMNAGFRT